MIRIQANGIDEILKKPIFDKVLFRERCREFLEELSYIGIQSAAFRFMQAEYDGENDVAVDAGPVWVNDNTLRVRASGKTVLFIEFGTGIHYAEPAHPRADDLGMIRGGYGHHQGLKDTWAYYGEPGTHGRRLVEGHAGVPFLTHGNPANMCMYEAAENVRNAISETARRVFA